MSKREVCHCGNAKSSHHEGVWNCLAVGCNDCPYYRDDSKPDPLKRASQRPSDHPFSCLCYYCKPAVGAA